MATMNPFDLLGDDDSEDPSVLAAQQQEKPKKEAEVKSKPQAQAKLPSKPVPPAQDVWEAKNEPGRGGGRGGGRGSGRGRGSGGFSREVIGNGNANGFSGGYRPSEEGEAGKSFERRGSGGPRGSFRGGRRGGFSDGEAINEESRGSFRGGRRGGFSNGEAMNEESRGSFRGGRRGGYSNGEAIDEERPRRPYERHSGTGNEFKREDAGRGNWGTATDEIPLETGEPVIENEWNISAEKLSGVDGVEDANKETSVNEPEEKEPENKEMTLEEYEKILEEKRKALLALKTEERKVDVDKEFGSMQQLSNKKSNDEIFIKLGSEKDKRKDAADKDEKAKKSVNINEFLKPAEGERYYGRGRGRTRGPRGGYGGNARNDVPALSIEDPGQFPSLGGK